MNHKGKTTVCGHCWDCFISSNELLNCQLRIFMATGSALMVYFHDES